MAEPLHCCLLSNLPTFEVILSHHHLYDPGLGTLLAQLFISLSRSRVPAQPVWVPLVHLNEYISSDDTGGRQCDLLQVGI